MDLFDLASPVETFLADKASALYQPIGGTLELTPLCNMDCKMCYVRQSKEQMDRQGRMLTADEWLKIAGELKESGVLFLLLTGGEPLVYPEFEKLYCNLTDMGFVVTINTNGTLLNEHWIQLFSQRPCRRLNITLYGKDDETYLKLCNNPNGFSRLMKNISLLNENNIPFRFNCSVTPYNYDQLEDLFQIAADFDAPMETTCHMFPPSRKEGVGIEQFVRLSPEEAAEAREKAFFLKNKGAVRETVAENTLKNLEKEEIDFGPKTGLTCRAGRSGFWITWKGDLLPCGLFTEPSISLKSNHFSDAWNYIVTETAKLKRCEECESCKLKKMCTTCGAACLTETGSTNKKPEYLCRMTTHLYENLAMLVK